MNYKTKKEDLEKEFNKNRELINQHQQTINQLATRQEQLKGQFQLIAELEKDGLSNKKDNNVGSGK